MTRNATETNGAVSADKKRDLFEAWTLKNVTFRNRFVLPAMQRGWGKEYKPSKKLREYYRRCVEGGIGLVITESVAIDHPSATGLPGSVVMLNEATAPAWKSCIDVVHDARGRIFMQLWHEGAIRKENAAGIDPSYPTLSPSGLKRTGHPNGRAATEEELDAILKAYVRAASLAKKMAADGVEIHAAHGYLLDQFLWEETNIRRDKFGGSSAADRARYPAEIVRSIRREVGQDFIISFRFSQWKEVDYSAKIVHSPSELKEMLQILRKAGVDIFHVSSRRFNRPEWPLCDGRLSLAGWVRSLTDAVVTTVGSVGLNIDLMDTMYTDQRIVTPVEEDMEAVEGGLARGDFDLVAVGRSVLADQEWVNKVYEKRFSDIVPFRREVLTEVLNEWDDSEIRDAHQNSQ